MAEVVRSPLAEQDLRDIFDQGTAEWGAEAAFAYVERFGTVWQLLSRYPEAGRERSELGDGLRSWRYRSHLIYYRANRNAVLVIRILHAAADPEGEFE